MDIITTDHLTKSYGKKRGIIDLNLAVKEGEFYGFIGPNGAGKSTTIRTLLGLMRPTSGSASIMNMDVLKNRQEILRNIGYIPSEAMFYSGVTVSEILLATSCVAQIAPIGMPPPMALAMETMSGLMP